MIHDIFVGIDPSTNSSGISILDYDGDTLVDERFFIIKPDKLSKKEAEAEMKINSFSYVLYDKHKPGENDNNHINELHKTKNFIQILEIARDIILTYCKKYGLDYRLHVCQEGISYGSVKRTKSIFDLAGLNYMLRMVVISLIEKLNEGDFTIATPSEIKKFTSGNGNCNKEVMVDLFKVAHPEFSLPKLDDISDSYWMATYARKIYKDNLR